MQQVRKSARQQKRELQVKRIKRTMVTVAVATVAGIMAATYCTALTYTKTGTRTGAGGRDHNRSSETGRHAASNDSAGKRPGQRYIPV